MSSTTITRGNSHETFYISPTLTPASVTNATTSAQTFTLPGILATDYVQVWGVIGTQTSGIVIAEADVTAANTIVIQFANCAAAPATPAAGQYLIQIVRAEGPLPVTAV
jgi:hypothetical protein